MARWFAEDSTTLHCADQSGWLGDRLRDRGLALTNSPDNSWSIDVGVKTTPQLRDGNAKFIVEATSNDFLRKTARLERDVTVITQPPTVSVDSEQHYLYLGMADLATFNVSGSWTPEPH